MSEASDSSAASGTPSEVGCCPLDWPAQRRNLTIFTLCTGMQYLAAPLLYVGITQGALGKRLEADAAASSLPQTLFFAMMAVPPLIAWASPKVSSIRRNLSFCYLVVGLMQALVAVALATDVPNSVKLAAVILQGGSAGALISTAIALLWEVVARGTDESRRGLALGLAFGLGPLFAVVGSAIQIYIMGDLPGTAPGAEPAPRFPFPQNFVLLFGLGAPVMAMAAALAQFSIVPKPEKEAVRQPASQVLGLLIAVPAMFIAVALLHASAVVTNRELSEASQSAESSLASLLQAAGLLMSAVAAVAVTYHFRGILSSKTLLAITIVTILLYAGNGITTNMNGYSKAALGDTPDKWTGEQNILRFSFKMATGLVLGWLLTRTNPRTGLLATALLLLASQFWATAFVGPAYLIAFGIYGAGELVGVYAPNYLASASRPEELRRNMAYATLLMVPAAPAVYFYGSIVKWVQSHGWTLGGMSSEQLGYRASFVACSLVILAGTLIALFALPPKPAPDPAPAAGE